MSCLRGWAMHLNKEVSVSLSKNTLGQHRLFLKDELLWTWGTHDLPLVNHQRNSIVEGVAGLEHWSAALGLYRGEGLDFSLSDPEFPLFEGSAWLWTKVLQNWGEVESSFLEYDCPLESEWKEGKAEIHIEPANSFSVTYSLDSLQQSFCFQNGSLDFKTEIIPCRTFILASDLEKAQAEGLLLGAKEGMGVLLDSYNPISVQLGAPLRFKDEFVRHKILDLVGDLLLLQGALPKLKISIRNGGHSSHYSLLQRIDSCLY